VPTSRPKLRLKSDRTRNRPWLKGKLRSWPVDRNVDLWIEHCCHLDPTGLEPASALRRSWERWCEARGLGPGHRLHLGQQLTLRGLPAFRAGARHMGIRAGIRVLPPERAV
jgi:hypothetical protein